MKHIKRIFFTYGIIVFLFILFDYLYSKVFVTVVLACPIFMIITYIYYLAVCTQVFPYTWQNHREFSKKYPPLRGNANFSHGFNFLELTEKDFNSIEREDIKEKLVFMKYVLLLLFVSIFGLCLAVTIIDLLF